MQTTRCQVLALGVGLALWTSDARAGRPADLCPVIVGPLQDSLGAAEFEKLRAWCGAYDPKQPPREVMDLLPGERLDQSDVSALMQLVEPSDAPSPVASALAALLGDPPSDADPPADRANWAASDAGISGKAKADKPTAGSRPCAGLRAQIAALDPDYASGPLVGVGAVLSDHACLTALASRVSKPVSAVREELRQGAFVTVVGAPADDVRVAVRIRHEPVLEVRYARLVPLGVGPFNVFLDFVPRGANIAVRHERRSAPEQGTSYLPSVHILPAQDWSQSTAAPSACARLAVALNAGDRVAVDGTVVFSAEAPPSVKGGGDGAPAASLRTTLRLYAEPGHHRLRILPSKPDSAEAQERLSKFESDIDLPDEAQCIDHVVDVRDLKRAVVKVVAHESCERKGLILDQLRRFAVETLRSYADTDGSSGHVMDFEAWAQSVAGLRELRDGMGDHPELRLGSERGYLDVNSLLGFGTEELWRQGFAQAYVVRVACADRSPMTTVVAHELQLDALFRAGRDRVLGADRPDLALKTRHSSARIEQVPHAISALFALFRRRDHLRVEAPRSASLFPAPRLVVTRTGEHGPNEPDLKLRAQWLPDSDAPTCGKLDRLENEGVKLESPDLTLSHVQPGNRTALMVRTPGTYLVQARVGGRLQSDPLCLRVEDYTRWLLSWVGWMRTWDLRDEPHAARNNVITVLGGFMVDAKHTRRATVGMGVVVGYGAHAKSLSRPPAWDGLSRAQDYTSKGDLHLGWTRHGILFGPVIEPSIRVRGRYPRARPFRVISAYSRLAILGSLGFIATDQVPSSLVAFRGGHGGGALVDFDVDLMTAWGMRWRFGPATEFAAALLLGFTGVDDYVAYLFNDGGRKGSITYDFAPAVGFGIEVSFGL